MPKIHFGYWVLETACLQTNQWQEQYSNAHSFTINVNFFGRQLQMDDCVECVGRILETTAIDPAQLKLEITESVMMKDVENSVARMHRLKSLGIKLAMDGWHRILFHGEPQPISDGHS